MSDGEGRTFPGVLPEVQDKALVIEYMKARYLGMKALNRTPEESSAKRDAEALSRTTLWIGIVSASSSGMSMRIRRRLSLPSPLCITRAVMA